MTFIYIYVIDKKKKHLNKIYIYITCPIITSSRKQCNLKLLTITVHTYTIATAAQLDSEYRPYYEVKNTNDMVWYDFAVIVTSFI
jgi:hypothetical protein